MYNTYCFSTATMVARGDRGSTEVKVLCYKSGRSLVRSQMVSLEIFIDIKSFRSHYGPGVDSASNRNEYQEYFLGVKAAGAYGWQPYHHPVPLSCNLGTLTSWNPLGHSRPVKGLIYLLQWLHELASKLPYTYIACIVSFYSSDMWIHTKLPGVKGLNQRFPTFLTRGALFRINFYGGVPCLPYVLQVNGV